MKFECYDCVDKGQSKTPCIVEIKGLKKGDRENWREALRRCPFENSVNNKFTGEVPRAHWV